MATLRGLDLAVIVLYMGAMALVGLWFARRQTTTERYFVAGRSMRDVEPNVALKVKDPYGNTIANADDLS